MRTIICALLVATALGATSANAATIDQTGYAAIKQGDFSAAERTLNAERRIYPSRPELMLNLAAVYRHTGRDAEARSLYQAVLAKPNVLLDMTPDVTAWSHELAMTGLRQLSHVQLSSR